MQVERTNLISNTTIVKVFSIQQCSLNDNIQSFMIKDRKLVGCIAHEEYYTISGKKTWCWVLVFKTSRRDMHEMHPSFLWWYYIWTWQVCSVFTDGETNSETSTKHPVTLVCWSLSTIDHLVLMYIFQHGIYTSVDEIVALIKLFIFIV